jgi:DNA-binding LacI/PurR family transcriptional regulator
MASLDFSSSAGQVYKRILRHVRIHQLREGDLLPSHPLWRKELGCGSIPFSDAMRLLESQGVIERRKKAGTRLLRGAPSEPVPWSIGLCHQGISPEHGGVLHAVLAQQIHVRLQAAGCQVRIYHNRKGHRLHHYLDEFDPLLTDVEAGKLDGLLIGMRLATVEFKRLGEHGVTVCPTLHGPPSARQGQHTGVRVDEGPMIRQAATLLNGLGCRRIALIVAGAPWVREEGYLRKVFHQAIEAVGAEGMDIKGWNSVAGGVEIARVLLDMRPEDRPDGLICTQNDYVTLGITHALRENGSYRPRIASFANRHVPLPFLLPVFRFELDVAELAQKKVDLLLKLLQSPGHAQADEVVIPRLSESEAALVPACLLKTPASLPEPKISRVDGRGHASSDHFTFNRAAPRQGEGTCNS